MCDVLNWLSRQYLDTSENGEPARLDTHVICNAYAKSATSCQANESRPVERVVQSHVPTGQRRGPDVL